MILRASGPPSDWAETEVWSLRGLSRHQGTRPFPSLRREEKTGFRRPSKPDAPRLNMLASLIGGEKASVRRAAESVVVWRCAVSQDSGGHVPEGDMTIYIYIYRHYFQNMFNMTVLQQDWKIQSS